MVFRDAIRNRPSAFGGQSPSTPFSSGPIERTHLGDDLRSRHRLGTVDVRISGSVYRVYATGVYFAHAVPATNALAFGLRRPTPLPFQMRLGDVLSEGPLRSVLRRARSYMLNSSTTLVHEHARARLQRRGPCEVAEPDQAGRE